MITLANPCHPGEILREECIKSLGLTINQAAEALKISRVTLSSILNGHHGISSDMAVKVANVFGSTPEMWLRLQQQYDLARSRKKLKGWKPKRSYCEMEQRV